MFNELVNQLLKGVLFISGNQPTDFHEIIPNLFIGNFNSAKYYSNNFDVVINATPDINFYSNKTKNIRISVKDDMTKHSNIKLAIEIEKILPYIHKYLQNNKKVLIHCRAGMQRSASIVASYLIRYKNKSINESIQIIKNKRNIAFMPYVNFQLTLDIINHNTHNKNKHKLIF